MGHLQFEDDQTLSAQPISDEETRKVIALWAEEHAQQDRQAAQPNAQAIAEALGIPPDEVLRLLQRVRQREAQAATGLYAPPAYRHRSRPGLWVAALVLALLASVVLLRAMRSASPVAIEPAIAGDSYTRAADGTVTLNDATTHYRRDADGSVTLSTAQGRYERRADGSLTIVGPEGTYKRTADGSVGISGPGGRYTRRADGSEERTGNPPERITPPDPPPGVTLPEVP